MTTSPGFSSLPAPHQPPRRPLSRVWLAAAGGFAAFSLVSIASCTFLFVSTFFGEFIDDYEILAVIETECERMTDEVGDLTVTGSPTEQAGVILQQNAAAQSMLDAVRALDRDLLARDHPTLEWLADWDRFLQTRAAFAVEVERGENPELAVPLDPDGDEIIHRMDWASEPECVVPEELLDPYPAETDAR